MKKQNKVIATALGTATLGGSIILATVAQECTTTISTDPITPVIPNEDGIIQAINDLNNYNGAAIPNDPLAIQVLAAIQTSLDGEGNLFQIQSLNFVSIDENDITHEENSNYVITISNIGGLGLLNNQEHIISGTAEIPIRQNNQAVTIDPVTGVTSTNQEMIILTGINELVHYESTSTAPQSSIGIALLAQINSSIGTQEMGTTATSIDFTAITATEININSNNMDIEINIESVTGTTSSGDSLSGNLAITLTLGESTNALEVTTISGIRLVVTVQEFLDALNLPVIQTYDATTSNLANGTLQFRLVAAIRRVVHLDFLQDITINNFTYTALTIDDVIIAGSGSSLQYTVRFRNFSGNATAQDIPSIAVNGSGGGDSSIQAVFRSLDTPNTNNITVGDPFGIVTMIVS